MTELIPNTNKRSPIPQSLRPGGKAFLWGLLAFFIFSANNAAIADTWTRIDANQLPGATPVISASQYLLYQLDEAALRSQLFKLPVGLANAGLVSLPMPDGSMRSFRVWQSPVMPASLADRYQQIKTFTAIATDNSNVTAKLDFTLYGFHAIVFDGGNTSFIDPYDNSGSGYYMVHYKRDEIHQWSAPSSVCIAQHPEHVPGGDAVSVPQLRSGMRVVNGYQLRTYRFALSCSHKYAQAATGSTTPSISQVLSKMTTTLNRVNGVYEREMSVTFSFTAHEDTLIWNVATGGPNGDDPFSTIDTDAGMCLGKNQSMCDLRIGSANYDIGHVFTIGAGGLSLIGIVCQGGIKAESVTGQPSPVGDGFDIDYVAHEMGHECGADHPFNNNSDGSCGGNAVRECAYEPGSGSTIMAYAGICNPDDLQPHSDDYFHAISLMQIRNFLTTLGDGCAVKTPTGNKLTSVTSFAGLYNIPYKTPFELTAPTAVDSVGDTAVTYCWEEWDLGSFGAELANTFAMGPIFRSYHPVKSPTRVFPKDTMVLAGMLSNAGIEDHEGEKAPDTARILTFRLTLRDIYNGNGCFVIPDDTILLDVINTGRGFKVTSQSDSGGTYIGGTFQNITWDVANTNTGGVNTPYVDIYMSDDGGYNWPYFIGTFPNNGSVDVPFPNPPSDIAAARIKVKGSGNVFFNVNKYNFAVAHSDSADTVLNIYPNPAHSVVRLYMGNEGQQQFVIYNSIGKKMYEARIDGIYDIAVSEWPRGMYFVRFVDPKKNRMARKFVLN